MKIFFLKFISLYQKTLSPDHSQMGKARYPHGFCRFYPSCSEFVKQAIERHGVLRGVLFGLFRILRCNPLSRGGVDEVSNSKNSNPIRIIRKLSHNSHNHS